MSLFEVEGLRIAVQSGERWATAVADASFSVAAGEVLALVGESGSREEPHGDGRHQSLTGRLPGRGLARRFSMVTICRA